MYIYLCNRLQFIKFASMSAKKPHITIHDIAKELGISASTVSRALKDNPRISSETKNAVRTLAKKYKYRPNALAASLRNGKGNTVGVIVPNIHRSFFSTIIAGIEDVLSLAGYNLMICQSNEKLSKEKSALSTFLDARVDAIFMSLSMETESYSHLEEIIQHNIKMVFFDRVPIGINVPSVVIDDYKASYSITKHLIQNGYRKLAHIGGSDKINVYAERRRGFMKALEESGLESSDYFMIEEDMTVEGGRRAFKKLIGLANPPDAIMCAGDFPALGLILSARESEISIPDEIAVTGFANEDFTAYISPSLTTVDQRGMEIGQQVARRFLLSDSLNENDYRTIIEPEIIQRESVKYIL